MLIAIFISGDTLKIVETISPRTNGNLYQPSKQLLQIIFMSSCTHRYVYIKGNNPKRMINLFIMTFYYFIIIIRCTHVPDFLFLLFSQAICRRVIQWYSLQYIKSWSWSSVGNIAFGEKKIAFSIRLIGDHTLSGSQFRRFGWKIIKFKLHGRFCIYVKYENMWKSSCWHGEKSTSANSTASLRGKGKREWIVCCVFRMLGTYWCYREICKKWT